MPSDESCPSGELLFAFGNGRLQPPSDERIANHIAGCGRCCEVVDSCQAHFALFVQQAAVDTSIANFGRDEEYIHFQSRLLAIHSVGSGDAVTQDMKGSEPRASAPRVISSYLVEECLGEGGFGTVYRVRHVHLQRVFALKLLHRRWYKDEAGRERFRREILAVGQVDHPNVVSATDAGVTDGCAFLVMDYLTGYDASTLVRRNGPLRIADACEVIRQACVGLAAIHNRGLVHRDLKPSNLFVTTSGQVKILDLGLTRLANQNSNDELTESNVLLGTLDYMAPEQSVDPRRSDIRADIYSLGCTLFKLLAGVVPHATAGTSPAAKVLAHSARPVPALKPKCAEASDELQFVLGKLMARIPSDRPVSPEAAADLLTPFCFGHQLSNLVQTLKPKGDIVNSPPDDTVEGLLAPTQPIPRTTQRTISRRLLLRAIAAGSLTAGAASFGVMRWASPEKREANVWYDVLRSPPELLLWRNVDGGSSWTHDPGREELWVSSDQAALFGMGTSTGYGFSLSVSVRQQIWTGGFGVFWGFQASPSHGEHSRRFQSIEVTVPRKSTGPPSMLLSRVLRTVRNVTLPHPPIDTTTLASHSIPFPLAREYRLEVTVDQSELRFARWDGQQIEPLCRVETNRRFNASSYLGDFGVFNRIAACRFSSARAITS